ncbi:class Ib ribonucleoside-diphosphate reductase assembly flavoprotein NrdI [Viridibacillus arvi]|uniref:class Ib ribonucleoside-diphosphate reductase assembly flavoprotein NrdI n=1 Tax=Viridibacillus arvi TaxID=263475 RepID=UPI0034CE8CA8
MIIAYASLTGKVKHFADRLQKQLPECEFIKVKKTTEINEPFILVTYTFGHGEIPNEVKKFMLSSGRNIVAVAGSGEKNWGEHRYCKASIDIAKQYDVPLLHNFEKMGYDSDVDIVATKIKDLLQKGMI